MPHSTKLVPDVVLIASSLTYSACCSLAGTATTNPSGTASSQVLSLDIKAFRFNRRDISETTIYSMVENLNGRSVSARWMAIFHKARKYWLMLCRTPLLSVPVTSTKKYRKYESPLRNALISILSGVF